MNFNLTQIMRHALKLAEQGRGLVEPNPMVGALLLYKGQIVSEAYHKCYGEAHAERLAIDQLDPSVPLQDCTLVVTLEPCSHFGKTPPCAEYIIQKGIKHVIVATPDPNPRVNGQGIKTLKAAGITVEIGVAALEAQHLNVNFYRQHELKRPYITLKWAESADGFIAAHTDTGKPLATHISGPESNIFVHKLRAQHESILIGKQTLITDNPELTVRHVSGKNPIRLIWCTDSPIEHGFNIFNAKAKTVIIQNGIGTSDSRHWFLQKHKPLALDVAQLLYNQNIYSVLVEGGAKVIQQCISEGIANRIIKIVNPHVVLKKGVKAPQLQLNCKPYKLGEDFVYDIKY